MAANEFKRIIVATDGSDSATNALRGAAVLAEALKAHLVVINVLEPEETSAIRGPEPREFARAEHLLHGHAEAEAILSEDILGEAKDIVNQHPGVNASYIFLDGDPATEIVNYADEVAADMIVMGSRGHNRIVGLLLGSVSQKVISTTHRFVLIAPAQG